MIQKIKLMKNQLHLWNKKYLNTEDVHHVRSQSILNMIEQPSESSEVLKRKNKSSKFTAPPMEEIKEEYSKTLLVDPDGSKSRHDLVSATDISFIEMEDIHKGDKYDIMEEEEVLLNNLKRKHLNWFTRICNWLKRFYSNQMLLISSTERLEAIECELRHGKHKINTTLENRLLISHYLE